MRNIDIANINADMIYGAPPLAKFRTDYFQAQKIHLGSSIFSARISKSPTHQKSPWIVVAGIVGRLDDPDRVGRNRCFDFAGNA